MKIGKVEFKLKPSSKRGIKQVNNQVKILLKKKNVILIGVAGGSASGKTTIAKLLSKGKNRKILLMDDYYIGINKMKDNNFDKPSDIDIKLLKQHLKILKKGREIKKPKYSYIIHNRIGYEKFKPVKIIVLDGLFALNKTLIKELDIKVFCDVSEKERLRRRIKRDILERGRTKGEVIKRWNETVEPMFKKYILPSKKYADFIIKN